MARRRKYSDVMDYLVAEQRSFTSYALADADLLACSTLAHLEFERAGSMRELFPLALPDIVAHPQARELGCDAYMGATVLKVLERCAASPRYRSAEVVSALARTNLDAVMQFGAVALRLYEAAGPIVAVAFRGTGSELTGWHEDFNLAVMPAIPSQLEAVRFLESVAEQLPDARFVLTGHSKGGALAEYAALFCTPEVQDRVEKVVSFDGPGLFKYGDAACPQLASADADVRSRYARAPFALVRYVFPSFVGLMLEERPLECLRYSAAVPKRFPHDITAVQIENGEPVLRVPSTDELLRGTALNRWLEQLTLDDRQLVIDAVFSEFYTHGRQLNLSKMLDLRTWAWFFSLHYAQASPEKRKALGRILGMAAREFVRR